MERHILIVDDEPNILNTLQRLLEEEDYVVYRAGGGQEGIEIIDANPSIGVVLSDQRMPSMTGTEFLKQIKLKHSNVVRMILSGYSELDSITQAINEGSIFKFLTKPWQDNLLLNSIQEAFDYYELSETNRLLTTKLQESNAKLAEFNSDLERRVEEKTHRLQLHIASLNIYQEAMEQLPYAIIGLDESLSIALENNAARILFTDATTSLLGLSAKNAFENIWAPLYQAVTDFDATKNEQQKKFNINQFTVTLSRISNDAGRLGKLLIIFPEPGA